MISSSSSSSPSSSSYFLQSLIIFFLVLCSLSITVRAAVSPSKTFNYVNEGNLETGLVEYAADYRPLKISNYPFRLCFYNSTPDSYILGIGMGNANSTSLMRWVWAANLNNPVGENAKLIFNRNGNLALIHANGRLAWQTNTTNKGVVDIKLLPNGNLVLLNKNGGFVWQSFYYPTNTLLVGQGLGPGSSSTNKIVNGDYSMVLKGKQLGLFFKTNPKSSSSKPLVYHNLIEPILQSSNLVNITFNIAPIEFGPDYDNELSLQVIRSSSSFIRFIYAQPKYNSTLSMFRLSSNGNVYIYTYYEKGVLNAWEETYVEFPREGRTSECMMPEKCGSLGICDDNQCVACPTPNGLMGWSKDCKPPILPSCDVSAANVNYYRIDGVVHFLNTYFEGEGPMNIDECKKKCSNNCKCTAFFYRKDTSMCLLTDQLYTLRKLSDFSSTLNVAYIKYAK